MPDNATAKRVWDLFVKPTPPLRKKFKQHPQVPPVPGIEANAKSIPDFSSFNQEHLKRVRLIRNEMDRLANSGQKDDASFNMALDFFESILEKENPDLLYYALEFFLVHYKGKTKFRVPSILVREPELVTPSGARRSLQEMAVATGSTQETKLDWFWESPFINEHHQHWHTVYGDANIDRQGEMFLYMHQQMIARYDAERIAEQVAKVMPYDNFSNAIAVGYAAGPDERLSDFISGGRNPQTPLPVPQEIQWQKNRRQSIMQDIDSGVYNPASGSLAAETKAFNKLGCTLEPSENADANDTKPYYSYHGAGHVIIAGINNGVMRTTVTAVRDVVFWEWHKGIDDFYFRLQERLTPYNFQTDAPPVLLRQSVDAQGQPYSSDIILVSGKSNMDPDAAENLFGGQRWNDDFENGSFSYQLNGQQKNVKTTNTLKTLFRQDMIRYMTPDGQLKQYPFTYLVHDPFAYYIRIQNNSALQKQVTVRIFMAPSEEIENRRMWIEMDKFLAELTPNSKTVLFRMDSESSVIKKPFVEDPAGNLVDFDPADIPQDTNCDCGWPYQMLLPKGKTAGNGMEFQLMVMVSDAAIDKTENESDCGSLSFCAARTSSYPDLRPLGYPFNRPFGANNIMNTIRSCDNMATRTIFIKHG